MRTRFTLSSGSSLRCRGWRQEGLLRLLEQRARDGNPGIGVLRHADAGYALAMERAESTGLAATVARGLP